MNHAVTADSARTRFQNGLLAWLRHDNAGLGEMIAVLRELSLACGPSANGILWRSAEAFLAALLDGTLPADDEAKAMCRRIERQLSSLDSAAAGVDDDLRDALFAYVSRRRQETSVASAATLPAELHKVIAGSLAKTAAILPLVAGAVPPRHSEAAVAAWLDAVRALAAVWHTPGGMSNCGPPATALVAAALAINAPACLQLAEALAAACGVAADEPAAREHPVLRAAIAAALEIAGERDAPNHPHFDPRVAVAVARLTKAEAETRQSVRLSAAVTRASVDPTAGGPET